MSETRAGTVTSKQVCQGGYEVTVFIGDAQVTVPSEPIPGSVLQDCRDRFSARHAPLSVLSAAGNIMVFPVDDIDGYIDELGLKRLDWPS